MAQKKKQDDVIQPEQPQAPEPVKAPQLTQAQLSKVVRVVNNGKPFECNLTSYGYGMRWPTNAVYFIPTSKFMELLEQGFEGQNI